MNAVANVRPSARRALRMRTSDMHARVDGLFSRADLSTRPGYAQFLMSQAAAYLPVEAALTAAGAENIIHDWNDRRRSALLLGDLERLDLNPPAIVPHVVMPSRAAIIGGVYVLEGSRLGGAMLKRSVAPDLPTTFLSAGDPAAWRRLIEIIDDSLSTEDDVAEAVASARAVFSTFEQSGLQYLEAN